MNINQNTQLTKPPVQKASALQLMASRLSCDADKLLTTLKSTVFQKATNEEMLALVVVANTYGLDPLLKEIYAFPAKGGGIVPIVSVDGWNKMLIRHPDFDGIEFDMVEREDGTIYSCTATVFVKNRSKPVKITEYYDECKRNTEPWNNMPRRMMRNRTLSQAARVAFGFSGVYHEDEAAPIIDVIEPPPKVVKLVSSSEQNPPVESVNNASAEAKATASEELESVVLKAGHDFATFQRWGIESGNVSDADSLSGFADIKNAVATRLLRNKQGMVDALARIKAVEV